MPRVDREHREVSAMALERLRREYGYDDWANREVLEALRRAGTPPPNTLSWLAHILGARSLWLARLEQRDCTLEVWPSLSLSEVDAHLRQLGLDWGRFLEGCGATGLGRTIAYTNTQGEAWTNRVEDVLEHVLLHGAYHRGQIASALRTAGHPPPNTDFIHAVRSGLLLS